MKQKLRTKRNPELHGGRIRIGIVADLPNRRYFFDGGWPSGRRMLSTHRSGGGRMYKPVAAYSRTRRRGRSLKISIRDFHCNERRAPIAAHRQEAFNFMQIDDGHRCERRAKHIPRPVPCLLLKCLHRPFRFPKYTGYCGFFEHRSSKRENFLSPNIFFLPFPFFSSYNIAYENRPLFFLSKKGERVRARTFLPCPRDLFFVTRESRDDSEMHRLCKYSGC